MEGNFQHFVVLGLGRSGLAVAEQLLHEQESGFPVRVTVLDGARTDQLVERAARLTERGAVVHLQACAVPADADIVVLSPGLAPTTPLVEGALELGVPVISELEFAYRRSASPFVAITGTNGKTTVTSLVAHLLQESGVPCEAVGNIGTPPTQVVGYSGPATVLVTEVSSFQLAFTERFHPRVSVLLNITPDHINWHGSLARYVADKTKVFANQTCGDTAVIDVDDAGSAPYADRVAAQGVHVCRVSRRTRFSGGATVVDGMMCLDDDGRLLQLIPVEDLRIVGAHNVSNALAAAAAAVAAGADLESVRAGLRSFGPVPHRLEPVGQVRGVEYFNDSKATNPDAVFKALEAFGSKPLVVMLGGRNKGNDFRPLAALVRERCRAAVLFGEAAQELRRAFEPEPFEHCIALGLDDATAVASTLAREGDIVLLSPACASFDEFTGYEQRGDRFRELVAALGEEEGQDVRA